MELSPVGVVVSRCWEAIPDHCPGVRLDRWVVMPDHVHGVIWLDRTGLTLGRIIGLFKAASTRGSFAPGSGSLWQRGFHDRIIRDDPELARIRRYIDLNPVRWID